MRTKLLSLLIVMLLLLASFSTVLAADAPKEPFCGGLDELDCQIIMDSDAAMKDVASYKATGTYSAVLAGIPGLPAEMISVEVVVDGAFAMDDAALAASNALGGLTQEEVAALLAESPETVVDLVAGWDFDAVLSVSLSPEAAAALSAESGLEMPEEIAIPVRLVDGIFYVDPTEAAPLFPELQGVEGWIGIELETLVSAAAEQGAFELAAAQMDPEAMAATAGDPASAAAMMAIQGLVSDPSQLEKFMSVERVEDVVVDDQDAAVFVTTFDILSFLTSPEFTDIVLSLAESGALGEGAPAEADIQQGLQMLGLMGPMIFEGLTAASSQTIGLDDSLLYEYSSLFAWDLSGLMQMAAMSGSLPPEMQPTGDEVKIEIATTVTNSEMNKEQVIEAPEDAMVIPAEQMMQ